MTLEKRQKAERERLERLCDSLDARAHDINSLVDVLCAYRDFGGGDPLPHIKAALRNYLERET
jgi:hypothetical protein